MDPADTHELQTLAAQHAPPDWQLALLWTAVVDVGAREPLGTGPLGERFIVPILGGRFWGGPGHAALRGTVRSGGADRQLLRPDGVKELRAVYELQADDGAVLSIDNQVVIDESRQPERYALSHVFVTAPAGPHAWLSRRVLVGTLNPLMPQRQAVMIRVYGLDK